MSLVLVQSRLTSGPWESAGQDWRADGLGWRGWLAAERKLGEAHSLVRETLGGQHGERVTL